MEMSAKGNFELTRVYLQSNKDDDREQSCRDVEETSTKAKKFAPQGYRSRHYYHTLSPGLGVR